MNTNDCVHRENLCFVSGTSYEHEFQIRNTDGTAFDLTNYNVFSDFRDSPAAEASVSLSAGSGLTISAADGSIVMKLTVAETTKIQDRATYDIRIVHKTTPDTDAHVLGRGDVYKTPAVTRSSS